MVSVRGGWMCLVARRERILLSRRSRRVITCHAALATRRARLDRLFREYSLTEEMTEAKNGKEKSGN